MKDLSPEVKAFSERMKQLREEKNLTRMAVSKDIGVHFNSINEYERGRVPSLDILKKIKEYYNVSYEYLFSETDVRTNNAEIQAINNKLGLDEEAIEYLETLDKNDEFFTILNLLIKDTKKCRNQKKEDSN